MKIARIFGVVLALHVVGGILFIQPGCQSQPRPQADETTPATGAPTEQLDWEEDDAYAVSQDRPRAAPTRPAPQPSASETTGGDILTPLPSGLDPLPSGSGTTDRASGGTYTVRPGDSLWVIANRNKVSLGALLSANGLTEDSVIQPGQELRLPAGSSSSATSAPASRPSGTSTYTVRSGDSLSVIAQRHNTTVANLKSLNNMSSDVIRIDQKLIVPEGGSQSARPRASSSSSRITSSGASHTVKAGETPGGIAAQYGISVKDLMSANNISDPRRMRIGQELSIPGGQSSTTAPASRESSGSASQPRESAPAPRPAPAPSEPVRAPTPQDIPVLPSDEEDDFGDEEEDFPIIPIVPSNG